MASAKQTAQRKKFKEAIRLSKGKSSAERKKIFKKVFGKGKKEDKKK